MASALPSSPHRAGVVIADDDPGVRSALAELIQDDPRLLLFGVAESGAAAATLCEAHHPAVAVVDVMMPTGGTVAVHAIRAVSPCTIVVAFTAHADRRTRERLLASGAAAVVAKGGGGDICEQIWQLASTHEGKITG